MKTINKFILLALSLGIILPNVQAQNNLYSPTANTNWFSSWVTDAVIDENDDGIFEGKNTIKNNARIYGYFGNRTADLALNLPAYDRWKISGNIVNGIMYEYTIPKGACMDRDGLPAIIPINIDNPAYLNGNELVLTRDNFYNPNGSNKNYVKKIKSIVVEGWFKKITFEDGDITYIMADQNVFEYKTAWGDWISYINRDDVELTQDCNITAVRMNAKLRAIYTHNIKIVDDSLAVYNLFHKGEQQGGYYTEFGTSASIAINGDPKRLTEQKCETVSVKISVGGANNKDNTDTKDTSTSKTDNDKPTRASFSSGPGGYTPNVTPIKTEVEPPKPTVNENTPSAPQKEEKVTEIKEEIKSETPKPETPSFSMDFVEVVTQKLPSILPKMGAFTGSSRSGNGMIRDNHGILRSVKDIIKLLDTKINSRDFRLAGSTNTELSHWLQVLDSHEKNMDKYVVIPSVGLVMPIADVAKTDKAYKNFLSGKTEHFYDYAGKGAVGIPDVGNKFGENGNKIIAGHSSWWKDDTSVKYKTHFQKIINLKAGTEIWVYEKNTKTGEYTRHVYQANESYNTSETDVSILKQTKDSTLTLFTCTPVGGDIGRWVVKAKLVR